VALGVLEEVEAVRLAVVEQHVKQVGDTIHARVGRKVSRPGP
jgi:hypothetical protein